MKDPNKTPSLDNVPQVRSLDEYTQLDAHGEYDNFKEHGMPYDRGAADAWYARGPDPHYWPGGTGAGTRVEMAQMTLKQIDAYYAGFYIHDADPGYRKQYD